MSGKTIVLYSSRTGFTQRYAQWIAGALGCEAKPFDPAAPLEGYDTVIYGGGFKAGMIRNLKPFMVKAEGLAGARIAVFATGAMPAAAPDAMKAMRQNFTDEAWARIAAFYLPGGLRYEKMGFGDKLMMSVFKFMVGHTDGKDSQVYKMIASSYDLTDEAAIAPVVAWAGEEP